MADTNASFNNANCLIVIFGASGDLTHRKLVPALYDLAQRGLAPDNYAILGISRTKYTNDRFRDELHEFANGKYDGDKWRDFAQRIQYLPADATKMDDWPKITQKIRDMAQEYGTRENIMFYLSLSPQFFEPVINHIGTSGLVEEGKRWCSIAPENERPWQRIVVEKPFGYDPQSAAHLNRVLGRVFEEEAIYRIDHYLAKELVQNLMVVRFANSIFEPVWNQHYIDHVQITATETIGVDGRGSYYDSPAGGAMRDMVQSHLMQIASLVAMEPPVSMDAQDIRTEKVKVFKAMRIPTYEDVPQIAVRGQYGPGTREGEPMIGYREEEDVNSQSQTDTFAAMQVFIDTWRWGGTPFYLRSGKAMTKKLTEIVICFKPTPHCLFREQACDLNPNQIIINVQPDEGIRLRFEGKVPGHGLRIKDVVMDFDYLNEWGAEPPDAYMTLLYDVMIGDQTLFKHRDEIEASWYAVQPVLDYWKEHPQDDLPNYAAGAWGPAAADEMMRRDGRKWHNA